MHDEKEGAFTGEVSPAMLAQILVLDMSFLAILNVVNISMKQMNQSIEKSKQHLNIT